MSRQLLTTNFSGAVRRAEHNGRQYLVAPMTLINPGVLNGSKGPLYYPIEEISKTCQSWNGVPIVVDHPRRFGQPISAADPSVLDVQGIGEVRNATSNGKLRAEGWFDVEKTRRINPDIFNRLVNGVPIELSTGLFTDNEERLGIYNGRQYTAIARNYRPDHLAVLSNQVGACSIQDGCGVLVNTNALSHKVNSLLHGNILRLEQKVDEILTNESYFSHCERDDKGRCKPAGGSKKKSVKTH